MRQASDIALSVNWDRAIADGTAGSIIARYLRYAKAHSDVRGRARRQRSELQVAFIDDIGYEVWSAFPTTRQGVLAKVNEHGFL